MSTAGGGGLLQQAGGGHCNLDFPSSPSPPPKGDTWRYGSYHLLLITYHCISARWRGWSVGPGVDVLYIGRNGLKPSPVSCLLFPVSSFPRLPILPSPPPKGDKRGRIPSTIIPDILNAARQPLFRPEAFCAKTHTDRFAQDACACKNQFI